MGSLIADIRSALGVNSMRSPFSFEQFKKLSYSMAALFLVVHILLFYLFKISGVMPMCYVNIGSILFYCIMLAVVRLNQLHGFVVATYFEICLHMGLAEYYTGWNNDFQITLIGICILLFYAEYIGRSMHISYTPSIYISPAAVLAYIVPLVFNISRPAPYALPSGLSSFFKISWAILVFSIALPILHYFVRIATRAQEELTNEVLHDKLTNLPSRYYMSDFFGKMGSEAHYWVAIADIDNFKHINDTYGHNCGDYVLSTVAELIRMLPPEITYCRWGGEEFLLAGKLNNSNPKSVLEDLRKMVEAHPFQFDGTSLNITITIGAAWFIPGQSIDEWIEAADQKLYEGKSNGKNRVII